MRLFILLTLSSILLFGCGKSKVDVENDELRSKIEEAEGQIHELESKIDSAEYNLMHARTEIQSAQSDVEDLQVKIRSGIFRGILSDLDDIVDSLEVVESKIKDASDDLR
ncbi:hypothetical protein [Polynucleobacter sp. AP-Nino-20-G2]|uniref:hypothetical protein n=1 Tax=Polynucleobacter sp. AP-Nino-20-G2 TaxID=2576917 RepID=UPI001BFD62FE|nr:hypothetical protein [Polynucleobacter sp. AP-Nino-20-G2]QWE17534.1 hypothetical protein FD960_04865 [Polynucleobacter sp. AP-Nino-20-G2]